MPADLNLRRTKPAALCNLISLDKQEIDGELEMLSKQKINMKAKKLNQFQSRISTLFAFPAWSLSWASGMDLKLIRLFSKSMRMLLFDDDGHCHHQHHHHDHHHLHHQHHDHHDHHHHHNCVQVVTRPGSSGSQIDLKSTQRRAA